MEKNLKFEFNAKAKTVKFLWTDNGVEHTHAIKYQREEFAGIRRLYKEFNEAKAFSRKLELLATIFNMSAEAKGTSDLHLLVGLLNVLFHYNWGSPFIQ